MFAAFEATLTVGIAAGALLTPLVINLLGIRLALVAVGLVAPIAVVACWAQLRRLDARMRVRDADIELLHNVPMLRVLPQATIEQLAAALDHAEVAPGHAVFEQGDHGDHFYVVEAGRADVVHDGRPVETLARGESFGEIALLHDMRADGERQRLHRCATARQRPSAHDLPDGRDRLSGQRDRRGAGRRRAPRTGGQRGLRHCQGDDARHQSRAPWLEGVGQRGGASHRGRRQSLGRNASALLPAACGMGDRPLPEGRVGPPDGIAEAPARPLAVPLRPVQRLDHRAHDDRRGVDRLDGCLRGLLRPLPGAPVHRGHAGARRAARRSS